MCCSKDLKQRIYGTWGGFHGRLYMPNFFFDKKILDTILSDSSWECPYLLVFVYDSIEVLRQVWWCPTRVRESLNCPFRDANNNAMQFYSW